MGIYRRAIPPSLEQEHRRRYYIKSGAEPAINNGSRPVSNENTKFSQVAGNLYPPVYLAPPSPPVGFELLHFPARLYARLCTDKRMAVRERRVEIWCGGGAPLSRNCSTCRDTSRTRFKWELNRYRRSYPPPWWFLSRIIIDPSRGFPNSGITRNRVMTRSRFWRIWYRNSQAISDSKFATFKNFFEFSPANNLTNLYNFDTTLFWIKLKEWKLVFL